jgi:hypothetical protein
MGDISKGVGTHSSPPKNIQQQKILACPKGNQSANSSIIKIARPPFLVGELSGLGEAGVSIVVQQLLPIHQLVCCL